MNLSRTDQPKLHIPVYHRGMYRQSLSSQTMSKDAEVEFFHDDENEEFSDEILLFAEAFGTENIFNPYQDIPLGNKMQKTNKKGFLCHNFLYVVYCQT